jgi:hypothetical protein
MHVSHDSYTLPNRLNKGDGAPGVNPASKEDPALEAATQALLISPQQSVEPCKSHGKYFNPKEIDKTGPEFQEWVTALLTRADDM